MPFLPAPARIGISLTILSVTMVAITAMSSRAPHTGMLRRTAATAIASSPRVTGPRPGNTEQTMIYDLTQLTYSGDQVVLSAIQNLWNPISLDETAILYYVLPFYPELESFDYAIKYLLGNPTYIDP